MVREKVKLKKEYKRLVRAGDSNADKILEKIWIMSGSKKRLGSTTSKPTKYTEEDLEKMSFSELRKVGYSVGTEGRGKEELVREILELQ